MRMVKIFLLKIYEVWVVHLCQRLAVCFLQNNQIRSLHLLYRFSEMNNGYFRLCNDSNQIYALFKSTQSAALLYNRAGLEAWTGLTTGWVWIASTFWRRAETSNFVWNCSRRLQDCGTPWSISTSKSTTPPHCTFVRLSKNVHPTLRYTLYVRLFVRLYFRLRLEHQRPLAAYTPRAKPNQAFKWRMKVNVEMHHLVTNQIVDV